MHTDHREGRPTQSSLPKRESKEPEFLAGNHHILSHRSYDCGTQPIEHKMAGGYEDMEDQLHKLIRL